MESTELTLKEGEILKVTDAGLQLETRNIAKALVALQEDQAERVSSHQEQIQLIQAIVSFSLLVVIQDLVETVRRPAGFPADTVAFEKLFGNLK